MLKIASYCANLTRSPVPSAGSSPSLFRNPLSSLSAFRTTGSMDASLNSLTATTEVGTVATDTVRHWPSPAFSEASVAAGGSEDPGGAKVRGQSMYLSLTSDFSTSITAGARGFIPLVKAPKEPKPSSLLLYGILTPVYAGYCRTSYPSPLLSSWYGSSGAAVAAVNPPGFSWSRKSDIAVPLSTPTYSPPESGAMFTESQ
mmetsp:Transcript_7470/g.15887  ORF Transcript_7470/g.15887 Transcript_7470/m.15887 type:complete len:201 (+) Transcript_7470:222-824(+)